MEEAKKPRDKREKSRDPSAIAYPLTGSPLVEQGIPDKNLSLPLNLLQ